MVLESWSGLLGVPDVGPSALPEEALVLRADAA